MNRSVKSFFVSAIMIVFSITGAVVAEAGSIGDCGELGKDCFTRWYAGVSVGEATLDSATLKSALTVIDDSDLSYGIVAGYRMNKFFGFEVLSNYFGEPGYRNVTTNIDGRVCNIGLGANFYLPLGSIIADPNLDFISLLAKGGGHYWDAEADASGTTMYSDDGADIYYGFGLNVDLLKFMAFRVEYTTFEIGNEDSVDNKSIKLLFKF